MNWVQRGGSTTFETKPSYCRVARQGLPCYTAVARLGFKRRATACSAKVEFNSFNWVRHVSSTTFETGLRVNSLGPYPLADLGNFLPKSRLNSLRTLHLNEQSVWPYLLTGNFVLKSVVYSDLKVLEMGALIRTLRNKGGPTRSSWA